MEMLCNFDPTLHATCKTVLIKSTAKESLKSSLLNSANHTVIACTATEIEALKDKPFIPELHTLGL